MYELNYKESKKRILIIDDDKDLTHSLMELMQEEGYDVDIASNGRDGIRLQSKNPYNLIITDIIMPEEDGLEVIMWVRKTNPNTKLIAISGGGYFDSREYLLMAKELGASAVLCKPFEISLLKSETKRLLGLSQKA
jgi:DNA-binding response OmpR family regulator